MGDERLPVSTLAGDVSPEAVRWLSPRGGCSQRTAPCRTSVLLGIRLSHGTMSQFPVMTGEGMNTVNGGFSTVTRVAIDPNSRDVTGILEATHALALQYSNFWNKV